MPRKLNKNGYHDFLMSKVKSDVDTGLVDIPELHPQLFPWQAKIVAWALRRGRACLFEECGLGKTFQSLEWSKHVPGDVIILTPLAVAEQTMREAERFGFDASISRDGKVISQITITNYEMIHKFDLSRFTGIVLDESSILKSHEGKTRNMLIEVSQKIPFRLACTATPAPNDYTELGNHSEFMGVMSRVEMLSSFFVHDGSDTSKWRIKGHAVKAFWKWVASWAIMIRYPSDIGYEDGGFKLPPVNIIEHPIKSGIIPDGQLFCVAAETLSDLRIVRRKTVSQRVEKAKEIIESSNETWIVWCELNHEGDELTKAIPGAVQIAGADNNDVKIERMCNFINGKIKVLVSKPSVCGFGMNLQHCHNMLFVGLSHSWEQFYQGMRRCWRFGQEKEVNVHIIDTDVESSVLLNIKRKQHDAEVMGAQMISYMQTDMSVNVSGTKQKVEMISGKKEMGDGWSMHLGDCVDIVHTMESDSIDYSIFSPPFASLYTYSDSIHDMGNCGSHEEFIKHFQFLVGDLLRVTKPGRLLSFHCMNIPSMKERDGIIGLFDFRGMLIKVFQDAGWIYHSEVTVWKDPVTAMQRTKALGLLYKQLRKDSCMCRQGIPDYVVTMRKPGENQDRVTKTHSDFPVGLWQNYASPIWMDIDQSDTLQRTSVRQEEDERHICPLQLGVIRRCIRLWTNPGDLVLSPFAGIGSEGHVALQMDRQFVGVELKPVYYQQACSNLRIAKSQQSLFDTVKEKDTQLDCQGV